MPAAAGPLLSVEGVSLSFGGIKALDDVSFTVDHRQLVAVIGPNGAGKTSVFNCISQVYAPQKGRVVLDGKPLAGMQPWAVAATGIGRTFQNLALFSNMNVIDNLMLGRHHLMRTGFFRAALWHGWSRREEIEHRAACEEIIRLLELEPYRKALVGLLPYGVQKRIELARALAMEPRLLLLDEPVAGMNLEETEDLVRYVLEVRQARGIAMIMVEHDMHVVMDIADKVVVLDFGRMIASGTPDEVQRHPEVVRAYLGAKKAETV